MKCRGRGFDAGNSPMAARRRRSSASQHSLLHAAALLAVAAVLVAAGSASAQAPRAWAGGDAAREPLRVAAAPPAADAPGAQETVIPTGNLLATIRDGGVLMIPLLGCSFALAVFGIERAVSLRTGRVAPTLFVTRFIEIGRAHV